MGETNKFRIFLNNNRLECKNIEKSDDLVELKLQLMNQNNRCVLTTPEQNHFNEFDEFLHGFAYKINSFKVPAAWDKKFNVHNLPHNYRQINESREYSWKQGRWKSQWSSITCLTKNRQFFITPFAREENKKRQSICCARAESYWIGMENSEKSRNRFTIASSDTKQISICVNCKVAECSFLLATVHRLLLKTQWISRVYSRRIQIFLLWTSTQRIRHFRAMLSTEEQN